jgi:hypothetical protein
MKHTIEVVRFQTKLSQELLMLISGALIEVRVIFIKRRTLPHEIYYQIVHFRNLKNSP